MGQYAKYWSYAGDFLFGKWKTGGRTLPGKGVKRTESGCRCQTQESTGRYLRCYLVVLCTVRANVFWKIDRHLRIISGFFNENWPNFVRHKKSMILPKVKVFVIAIGTKDIQCIQHNKAKRCICCWKSERKRSFSKLRLWNLDTVRVHCGKWCGIKAHKFCTGGY